MRTLLPCCLLLTLLGAGPMGCGDKESDDDDDDDDETSEDSGSGEGSDGGTDEDADDDGFASGRDCDDADPEVHPDATEVCNGIDDDCDHLIDDEDDGLDTSTGSTWYGDEDEDGFGDEAARVDACSPPEGAVAEAGDCDDEDGAVHPAATEVCNGIDDDCDGDSDDADAGLDTTTASTWYADADTDGYGDAATFRLACLAPGGFVSDATDCDDAAIAVHPSADEVCNEIDDDCDSAVDDADSTLDTATASTWYTDADGDGYGNADSTLLACEAPSGTVDDATDCDDARADVHPVATEVCNGIDDDCDGDSDDADAGLDTTTASTWYADADTDGYGDAATFRLACLAPGGFVSDATDCDDSAAGTHPGAAEVCDILDADEDCDGTADDVDISVTDQGTWYIDGDGDSFGDDATAVASCDQPSGTLGTGGDCNDMNAAIHPAATEICNETDDDCDGAVDDADGSLDTSTATRWYTDRDGDGYGSNGSVTAACLAPTGTVPDGGDCNDTNAAISPAAEEICWDTTDDDCDGVATLSDGDCVPQGSFAWSQSDYRIHGTTASGLVGTTVATGDVDGDGSTDLLVAGTGAGASAAGRAWVFYGPLTVPVGSSYESESVTTAELYITGAAASDSFGSAATLGDLDGDGVDDIAIGADANDDAGSGAGAVYLFFDISPGTLATTDADLVVTGASGSDAAGRALASGDLDADGIDDLLLGASGAERGANATGGAFVVLGGVTGNLDLLDADTKLAGERAGDGAGGSVAIAGDVNADGYADLLVGASGNDENGSGAGKVYLVYGPPSAGVQPLGRIHPAIAGDAGDDLGTAVAAAGDLDLDGYDDFVLGAPDAASDYGEAGIWFGPVASSQHLVSSADLTLRGERQYDDAGAALAAGDADADGYNDLLIAAPGADPNGASSGRVYLLRGPFTATGTVSLSTAQADLEGGTTLDYVGDALAFDDVDSDGYDDAVVGAWGRDDLATNAGAVGIFFGGGRISAVATGTTISLADDSDGDGYSEDAGDCDDTEPLANPAELEICDDGLDNDCNGWDPPCLPASGAHLFNDAEVILSSAAVGHDLATYVVDMGDFNGDGWTDVAAGDPEWTDGSDVPGAVCVFYGPVPPGETRASSADVCFIGEDDGDDVGSSFANAGDVNGDGFNDLLVGVRAQSVSASWAGRAYVIFGGSNLTGQIGLASADVIIDGDAADDLFGSGVGGPMDLDGDGTDDLLVGAPGAEVSGAYAGVLYAFAGPLSAGSYSASDAETWIVAASTPTYAGSAIQPAGDVNADGYEDLLIGVPDDDDGFGKAVLLYGPLTSGLQYQWHAEVHMVGETYVDAAGTAVRAAGDVNADGYADVLVSAPGNSDGGNDAGKIYLLFGPLEGYAIELEDADATFTGIDDGDEAGTAVLGADLDSDGYHDIIIGAPGVYYGSSVIAGEAYVFYGPITSGDHDLSTADITIEGLGRQLVGTSLDAADLNDDGYDDLIVGAPESTTFHYSSGFVGAAAVYWGGPRAGVTPIVPATISPSDDADGDGYTENAGDCDDSSALAHPGGIEICEDDLDNDCIGDDVRCVPSGTTSVSDVSGRGVYGDSSGYTSASFSGVAALGDYDGDGYADLLVGESGNDELYSNGGAAHVYFGPLPEGQLPGGGDYRWMGVKRNNYAGGSVVSAGDLDGDGFGDLLIGGNGGGGSGTGQVYAVFETASSGSSPSLSTAGLLIDAPGLPGARFGTVQRNPQDLDGDGFIDVVIGAPTADVSASDSGAAYLFYGPLTGGTIDVSAADARWSGVAADDAAGTVQAGVGDLDGDGLPDLALGVPQDDVAGSYAGAVYLQLGSSSLVSGDLDEADIVLSGAAWDFAGTSLLGDVDLDEDGSDDLLIGAPGADAGGTDLGVVYVVYGPLSGNLDLSISADARIEGLTDRDRFGASIALLDYTSDGVLDLAVAASPSSGYGLLQLAYGPLGLVGHMSMPSRPGAVITGNSSQRFSTVLSGGDTNGDGLDDLVVSAGSVFFLLPGGIEP